MIGWTYTQNRQKTKDAEQQLKDFQLQDRIDDLQNAKDAELKLLDDRISAWDEYLKALETKYAEYDRLQEQHLLKQLLNLQTQEEVTALITGDMLSFSNYSDNNQDKFLDDMIGAYMGFDTKFGTFLDDYKSNLEMLKYYNEQSLSFLDASNYNRANGAFLENVIEENLAPINPQIEYRSSGGGYTVEFLPVSTYGDIGDADIKARGLYNYNSSVGDVSGIQQTLRDMGISNVIVDGKYGDQTMSAIYQVFDRGTESQKAQLRSQLAAAGITYDEASNTLYTSGYIANYNGQNKMIANTPQYKSGSTGNNVTSIQSFLNGTTGSKNYYSSGSNSNADGTFGSATDAAVKAFQRANGLDDDGIIGPQTKAKMIELGYTGSFSSGILGGPVTYTGLAMLHGTPSSPEYVLNSDQAYSLLRYMATTKPETVAPGCGDTIYNFTGGITMNGVNDPEAFFGELMKATSNRFNVTKNRY